MIEFDYASAAREAGWHQVRAGWVANESRRTKTGDLITDAYVGTSKGLCRYLGIGPDWEAWRREPYKKPEEK